MKTADVIMVRVYMTESSNRVDKIISYLKNEAHVRGVSVFRAISGFGDTGSMTAHLVDLSLSLPLVVEFFDDKEKTNAALEGLNKMIKPDHIVFWDAKVNHP